MARASRSLPLPGSPRMSTGVCARATWRARRSSACICRAATCASSSGRAAELLLHQLGVGVVLLVEPLEGHRLARALHGDGQQLSVDLDQVDHRRRVHLAHGAVEREDAQGLIAGHERGDEAGMARGKVQHVVERVPVAVAVVLLEEGARPSRLQRLAQRRELLERERVLADAVVGEWSARGAHHQPALLEHEDRRQIVGRHARQPVEAAAEHVVDRVLRAHQRGELLEVAGEVDGAQRSDGCHGADSNRCLTEEPVFLRPLTAGQAPIFR